MTEFPAFMKHPANKIQRTQQATPGVEGYVFDGVDGSQMAFWTCSEDASSQAHRHDFDEYMLVVQGCYTLLIGGERIDVRAGQEYVAGTRTIHAVAAHQADRAASSGGARRGQSSR